MVSQPLCTEKTLNIPGLASIIRCLHCVLHALEQLPRWKGCSAHVVRRAFHSLGGSKESSGAVFFEWQGI